MLFEFVQHELQQKLFQQKKNLFHNIFLSNQMSYMRTSSWFHGSRSLHRFGIGAWHKSLQLVKKKID